MTDNFFRKNNIIQLTNQCNNNCLICQDKELKEKVLMKDFNELKKEVDGLFLKGVRIVSIYGGEPYLNKNITRLLDYLFKMDISCYISTNARIFSSEKLVRNLSRIKKVSVITTLFSYKKNIHEYLTNVLNSYNQTIKGIKNLIKFNISVTTIIVLTTKNIGDLLKTVKFLNQLGVRRIKISGLINKGRMIKRHDLIPNFDLVKKEIIQVINFTKDKNIRLVFEKLPFCVFPINKFKFKYEAQHKKNILICPNKNQCVKCELKHKCMCF